MKRLRDKVKRSIGRLGYEIKRKKNQDRLYKYSPTHSAGHILELMGPSGIGKSTLLSSVSGTLGKSWFLPRHALELELSSLEHDPALMNVHRTLLVRKAANSGKDGSDFWLVAGAHTYSAHVARTDILMHAGFPRGFALDEGLFQVFSKHIPGLDADQWELLAAGRLLVHLSARDPDTIADRAMRRYEERVRRGLFQHPKDFDTLRKRAVTSIAKYAQLADLARQHGIEVIDLYAEDPVPANGRALLDFATRAVSSPSAQDTRGR
jgi:energy-coupling factor transporter ATP-binding protein EcfA2